MPTVNRTPPPSNGKSKLKVVRQSGSILDEAIDATDLPDIPIHMLLYGKNGVGKTSLACKFPKPLLLVACEPSKTGGANSIKKMEGIKYLRVDSVAKVEQLAKELTANNPFETVVFDSGTSLDEMILAKICGWEKTDVMLSFGKVTTDQYVERSEQMRLTLRPYLELDSHVVLICNEKDHNPPESRNSILKNRSITDESFFGAAMGSGTARWAQDACDWVCQLYVDKEIITKSKFVGEGKVKKEIKTEIETGRVVRRLRLKYHTNFAARIRCPNPDTLPEYLEEPTWESISNAMVGESSEK